MRQKPPASSIIPLVRTVFFLSAPMAQWLSRYRVRISVPAQTQSGILKGQCVGRKEGNVLFNDILFYMHHPTDRITHTTAFVTPVVEH